MTARGRMTMRGTLQRDQQASRSGYGHKMAPDWSAGTVISCWLYTKRSGMLIDGDKTVTVESLRMMVPNGTDVQVGDQFSQVIDQQGTAIHSTPLLVQTVQRYRGHIELGLRDTSQA